MGKTYTGTRSSNGVVVEVVMNHKGKVHKRKLKHVAYHSPAGLEWGYHGSGPADLALSVLVNYFNEHSPKEGWMVRKRFDHWAEHSQAWKHHQSFKRYFVAYFDYQRWELTDTQIEKWLDERRLNT